MAENRQSGVKIETKYVDREGNVYVPTGPTEGESDDDGMELDEELREELERVDADRDDDMHAADELSGRTQ